MPIDNPLASSQPFPNGGITIVFPSELIEIVSNNDSKWCAKYKFALAAKPGKVLENPVYSAPVWNFFSDSLDLRFRFCGHPRGDIFHKMIFEHATTSAWFGGKKDIVLTANLIENENVWLVTLTISR